MADPRPEKVAIVEEVKNLFSSSDAAIVTEYRGINVADLARLRRSLRDAGGEYRIYKNTLVRFAARDLALDMEDLLKGPTAIAFVPAAGEAEDDGGGRAGDPVAVAKALRDFAKTNPELVIKGGVLSGRTMSASEASALADIPPREVLLARLLGAMKAPMSGFAGVLQGVPRNLVYGLQALVDAGGAAADTPPGADSGSPDESAETIQDAPSGAVEPSNETAGDTPGEPQEES